MIARRPRRVLMTADCVGGVWTYALDLVAGLAEHDVAVTMFVSGAPLSPARVQAAGKLDNLTLVRSELKLEWMDNAAEDVAATSALLTELEAEVEPDVVHVNGYANAAAGFSAPVLTVAHSCVETWWRAVKGEPAPDRWENYSAGVRAGVAASTCIVAPTRAHLRAFGLAHGRPGAARVIHNGRPTGTCVPGHKRDMVLAAGRMWDEAKNLAVLTDVVRCGVPITVAGDARGTAPGGDGITHLGELDADALARTMAAASVFVAPSLYEPFGLAVLEAALAECALIVGDIPTMRELWDGAAIFVDPRDPEEIAAAARDLLAKPADAREAGAAARARAQRYSREAMTRHYLTLYGGLMTVGAAGARAA